MFDRTPLL